MFTRLGGKDMSRELLCTCVIYAHSKRWLKSCWLKSQLQILGIFPHPPGRGRGIKKRGDGCVAGNFDYHPIAKENKQTNKKQNQKTNKQKQNKKQTNKQTTTKKNKQTQKNKQTKTKNKQKQKNKQTNKQKQKQKKNTHTQKKNHTHTKKTGKPNL